MPTIRETGKDRWRRVPKDYFKKRDRLQNLKLQLSGLALVLALGWWALGVDWTSVKSSANDLNGLRANHGELARVHTAWAQKCDACHIPFQPIDGRPLLSSTSVAEGRSSDGRCMSCHAGPSHHSSMIASEVKGCAECHRDHQGRDFSLVRLKDGECTSCHQALTAHIAPGKKAADSPQFGNVTQFAKDHPPFHPTAALFDGTKPPVDRSRLKFNHAQHMMPGIVKNEKDTAYTVERIPIVAERARYQKKGSLKDAVRLECSSCHVLDASEIETSANVAVGTTTLPKRNPGRYFLPVTFENQCRACHTQTFDPRPDLKDLEVPHGVQPDQVIAFLKRAYAAQVVIDDPSVLNRKVVTAPLLGKAPAETTGGKLLDSAVTKATRSLFENRTSCNECHFVQSDDQGMPLKVEPTNVPQIWFTHAAFDHSAHRGVSCRDCHPRSYAQEADGKGLVKNASTLATDVLIPAIDNCVQCHAPAKSAGWFASSKAPTTGGASFDCTECHRYHNGDNLLQGFGASAEDAEKERSIAEFLSGNGGKSLKGAAEPPGKP